MNAIRIRGTRVKIVTKSRVTCARTESQAEGRKEGRKEQGEKGEKEGRKEAREALLNFSRSNPGVTCAVYVAGTKAMRHHEGAKKNRWWPTEREKAGLLPEDASSSRATAGVLQHLRLVARRYFHRLVSAISFCDSFRLLLSNFRDAPIITTIR